MNKIELLSERPLAAADWLRRNGYNEITGQSVAKLLTGEDTVTDAHRAIASIVISRHPDGGGEWWSAEIQEAKRLSGMPTSYLFTLAPSSFLPPQPEEELPWNKPMPSSHPMLPTTAQRQILWHIWTHNGRPNRLHRFASADLIACYQQGWIRCKEEQLATFWKLTDAGREILATSIPNMN